MSRRTPTAVTPVTDVPTAWRCPPCGEPVHRRPPTAQPWVETWTGAHGRALPEWSHLDGEPLCPILTAGGYAPADPEPDPSRAPAVAPARRPLPGGSPQRAHEALHRVKIHEVGFLDQTDRVVDIDGDKHVRYSVDEDVLASLISQGYVTGSGARDVITCRHGAIRRPVTPLRLTPRGRALLDRWDALHPWPKET